MTTTADLLLTNAIVLTMHEKIKPNEEAS